MSSELEAALDESSIEASFEEIEIAADGDSGVDTGFSVFISYRVDPDQPLAIALKELVENAIDPSPRVFVSGAGGLRPSSIGFKPQIQAAAQSARAFVAIITQESKDREWIFFEAGCAWGRSQLYSPLLIDTTPGDLGSSIADYQAVRANVRQEVKRLVEEIAQATGGKVKPRFGTRYRAFESRLQAYTATAEDEGVNGERSPLVEALDILHRGDVETATKRLRELEEEATSAEEKARIRTAKIINLSDSNHEMLASLLALETELGETTSSQYWLGVFEPRQSVSIRHLSRCLELTQGHEGSYVHRDATTRLAKEQYRIGNRDAAFRTFRAALIDRSPELRSHAANAWIQLEHEPHKLEKLVLISAALFDEPDSASLLNELVELCLHEDWNPLLVYIARRAGTKNGTAANNLGRAYGNCELWSLAYLAYAESAEQGISVAKVNMASLTRTHQVPAVGLKILQDHTGRFDAADAGYPYDVWGDLERAVQTEEQKAKTLSSIGKRLFTLISNFGWEAAHGSIPTLGQSFDFSGTPGSFSSEAGQLILTVDGQRTVFEPIGETLAFLGSTNESTTTLLTVKKSGELLRLTMNLESETEIPAISEFAPSEPLDIAE